MLQTVSIIVTGKVQGVYYRQSTKEMALKLGIAGTVSNRSDGSVYILATGDGDQLEKFIKWCHQGPSRAVVDFVQVNNITLQHFEGFVIRRF